MRIVFNEIVIKKEPIILIGLLIVLLGTITFSLIKSYKAIKKNVK